MYQTRKYHPAGGFPTEVLQIGSDFSASGTSRPAGRNQRFSEANAGTLGDPERLIDIEKL